MHRVCDWHRDVTACSQEALESVLRNGVHLIICPGAAVPRATLVWWAGRNGQPSAGCPLEPHRALPRPQAWKVLLSRPVLGRTGGGHGSSLHLPVPAAWGAPWDRDFQCRLTHSFTGSSVYLLARSTGFEWGPPCAWYGGHIRHTAASNLAGLRSQGDHQPRADGQVMSAGWGQ